MLIRSAIVAGAAAVLWCAAGCESSYRAGADAPEERQILHRQVDTTLAQFKQEDPTMERFFENSWGYVVFPEIAKGGIGIGGARGHGEVYERGREAEAEFVGYATLTQGTIGAQLGGQTYSEIIFFQNRSRFEDFKNGNYEFAAQASAVAASKGASANADYDDGVAVFTLGEGGLMFEAVVGGQKFSFNPAPDIDPATGYAIPAEEREQDIEAEIDVD